MHHCSFPGNHLDRPGCAFIFWRLRVHQVGNRIMHGRHRVGIGRIDETGNLRIAAGQIDADVVSLYHHRCPHTDIFRPVTVIIHERFTVIHAVAPVSYTGAYLYLRTVQDMVHGRRHDIEAVFMNKLFEAARPDLRSADHRR